MNGQVVLISGGSKGIGQGITEDILARGGVVATFSRHATPFIENELAKDTQRKQFLWEPIDGTDFEAVSRFAKTVARTYGRIDALVNNAACITEQLLTLTQADDVHRMLALNLEMSIRLAQTCAKVMLTQHAGVILNISSINALRGHPGVAVYSATKAGLEGLTRALARELGPAGIRVNAIAPGYVATDLSTALGPREMEVIRRRTPLRRLAAIADMVGVVRFLLSAESSFITGQTLVVDGGLTC